MLARDLLCAHSARHLPLLQLCEMPVSFSLRMYFGYAGRAGIKPAVALPPFQSGIFSYLSSFAGFSRCVVVRVQV